jgi:outer membrane protein assembly factor BamB
MEISLRWCIEELQYTARVVKKIAAGLAVLGLAVAALYLAGFRLNVDGSGMIPRFVSTTPDFDALEADRARQRQEPMPPSASADQLQGAAPAASPQASTGVAPASPSPAVMERASWPDFRGPNRDGKYDAGPIRTNWPREGLPRLWKQPIGLGYGSFVVANGLAFTIEQRRNREVAAAYDVATGREMWTNSWEGEFVESMGGDGPRATPTYHQGRLFVLGALGELRCLDASSGEVVWRRDILAEHNAANLDWGMSASPLIVDDKVIVLPGGSGGGSVVAYHKMTGEPIWHVLDDRQAYTSPMLATIAGVRQIVVVTATRAVGLTTDQGLLLWSYAWATDMGINVAQPVLLEGDRVFISAGYGHGAAVFQVTRTGETFATRTIWENTRMKNKFTSSLLYRGHLYGLDEAILACIDAGNGELKWKGGRYGYGQVMLAGDHLIVVTEYGDLVLVKATPERHEEVARFSAIEGKTWNHPVIADGRLLVRNLREMAAFDIRPR